MEAAFVASGVISLVRMREWYAWMSHFMNEEKLGWINFSIWSNVSPHMHSLSKQDVIKAETEPGSHSKDLMVLPLTHNKEASIPHIIMGESYIAWQSLTVA